jgi:hypothetical protein
MFKIEKDFEEINFKVVIEFEGDYSNDPANIENINEIIDSAFSDWLNYEDVYDEEDLAEVENMNLARFICERLDSEGYSTINYSLEELED